MAEFNIDFWKAQEDYKKHVEKYVISTHSEDKREEMLSLERFAVWLHNEWPNYVIVKK